MALPLFFHNGVLDGLSKIHLEEDTAKHIVQVLRMQPGAMLRLTDGKGTEAVAVVLKAEKKKCEIMIEEVLQHPERTPALHIGMTFTKNSSRNEWLLEKATELGASGIHPLITVRAEKERFRFDRWNNIIISALIQSQQYHLPALEDPTPLPAVISRLSATPQKLIAHCIRGMRRTPVSEMMLPGIDSIILIGPEGDFTPDEVQLCTEAGFGAVSLGKQRLRTETAAMTACAYFNLINDEA